MIKNNWYVLKDKEIGQYIGQQYNMDGELKYAFNIWFHHIGILYSETIYIDKKTQVKDDLGIVDGVIVSKEHDDNTTNCNWVIYNE